MDKLVANIINAVDEYRKAEDDVQEALGQVMSFERTIDHFNTEFHSNAPACTYKGLKLAKKAVKWYLKQVAKAEQAILLAAKGEICND